MKITTNNTSWKFNNYRGYHLSVPSATTVDFSSYLPPGGGWLVYVYTNSETYYVLSSAANDTIVTGGYVGDGVTHDNILPIFVRTLKVKNNNTVSENIIFIVAWN